MIIEIKKWRNKKMKVLLKDQQTKELEQVKAKRITTGVTTMELFLYDGTSKVVDIADVYDISE